MTMRSDAQDGPRARVRALLPDVALALGVFVALNVLGSVLAGPRFDVTGRGSACPRGQVHLSSRPCCRRP
ncbi:hypothetical protein [Nannocystis pusilla]|uniref:hypothetical protein n=1 Tax=Nannocystis pusilla TaxID=889268 RepID=UPI003B7F4671